MGFLRKLKKRDDRFARVGKSKAAKRRMSDDSPKNWYLAGIAEERNVWKVNHDDRA